MGQGAQAEEGHEKGAQLSGRHLPSFWLLVPHGRVVVYSFRKLVLFLVFGFYFNFNFLQEAILRVAQPIVMGLMIKFLQDHRHAKVNDPDMADYYLHLFYGMGGSIIGLGVIYIFLYHPYFFKMTRKGMQLRIACCNLIYRKALRLSHKALGQTTVGQMVNLLSNDVNRFDYALIFVPFIFTAPLQAAITIAYLYFQNFGWSVFAGCSVLVVYLPFQMYMGTLFSRLRAQTAILTDERIRLMNELIPAMRVRIFFCLPLLSLA